MFLTARTWALKKLRPEWRRGCVENHRPSLGTVGQPQWLDQKTGRVKVLFRTHFHGARPFSMGQNIMGFKWFHGGFVGCFGMSGFEHRAFQKDKSAEDPPKELPARSGSVLTQRAGWNHGLLLDPKNNSQFCHVPICVNFANVDLGVSFWCFFFKVYCPWICTSFYLFFSVIWCFVSFRFS